VAQDAQTHQASAPPGLHLVALMLQKHRAPMLRDVENRGVCTEKRINRCVWDQLQPVTGDLAAAQADIEYLKEETSKMGILIKRLLAKAYNEIGSLHVQTTALEKESKQHAADMHEMKTKGAGKDFAAGQANTKCWKGEDSQAGIMLKRVLEKTDSETGSLRVRTCALENETKRLATDVHELKTWVAGKIDAWENSKKEKSDMLNSLRVETNDAQKRLESLIRVVQEDCDVLKIDFKQSLLDQGSALQSRIRSQMDAIQAELDCQKNALKQHKNARDTDCEDFTSLFQEKSLQAWHIKQNYDPDSPINDRG